jgi:branched-chain amino acid aminotransferase
MAILPHDQLEGMIWMNGELKPWADAKFHVLTHGLHYASCVFEGERAYNGQIFESEQHTSRLFNSARVLDFEIPFTEGEINKAKYAVLNANKLVDAYVRPVAWRGSEMMGVSAQANTINVAVAAWEWPSYFDPEARMKGIRLQIAKWRRPDPMCAPVISKAAGLYMICTLSKHAAEKEGYDDALMLDWRGQVAECTGANVFLVIDGEIHTPIPDCFLDGITRRTAIEMAKARGYKVIERVIMPEDLAKAQEFFITGTAAEITGVSEIDDYRFTVGEVTQNLMADYDAAVRMKKAA